MKLRNSTMKEFVGLGIADKNAGIKNDLRFRENQTK